MKRVDDPIMAPLASYLVGPKTHDNTFTFMILGAILATLMAGASYRAVGFGFDGAAAYQEFFFMMAGLMEIPSWLTGSIWQRAAIIAPVAFTRPGCFVARHLRSGLWYAIFCTVDAPHAMKCMVWVLRCHLELVNQFDDLPTNINLL